MNDSYVSKASDKNVFHDHQTPYILFYERIIEKSTIIEEKIIENNFPKNDLENKSVSINDLNYKPINPVQVETKELPVQPKSSEILDKINKDNWSKTKNGVNDLSQNGQKNITEEIIKKNQVKSEIMSIPKIEEKPPKTILDKVNEKSEQINSAKILSHIPSDCDTQDESEENNSIKSLKTYPTINFKSAKLLKMKSILKWMKRIQNSQKTEPIEIECSSSNNINNLYFENKTILNFSRSNPEEIKTINHNQKNESKNINGYINENEENQFKQNNMKSNPNFTENKSNKQNNYFVTKHLRSLFGSTQIDTWDTEEDSDLLNQQMNFVKSSETFKQTRQIQKDEYDVEYDTGKLKKIKKPKENHSSYNVFQNYHNNMKFQN